MSWIEQNRSRGPENISRMVSVSKLAKGKDGNDGVKVERCHSLHQKLLVPEPSFRETDADNSMPLIMFDCYSSPARHAGEMLPAYFQLQYNCPTEGRIFSAFSA